MGSKSSAPSVDNDGNTLLVGALYFNSVDNAMKVWNGTAWLDAYASLSGALISTNNLADLTNTATARTNLGVAIGTNVQAWDADLDTWATKTAPSGTVVGTSDSQTLTNKTLTTPVISSITNTGTLTLPTSTDTLVGRATTDTLTNKTIALGSNTVSGTLAQFNTAVTDADLVSIAGTETLTNKTLTSPVVTGGSINNTPIGATTANTGAFTTLSATGVTTVQAGTVSAPAITTSGDTNTGIFFPAADTIAFTEGGVESGRFTSTGALQLNNNLTFSGTGNRILGDFSNATVANRVAFQTSTANSNTIAVVIPSGTGNLATFQFYNNSDPTNAAFLEVGTRNSGTEARLTSGTSGTGTFIPMTFVTGGSERLRIDTSGNVGIGATSIAANTRLLVSGGRTNLVANSDSFALGVGYASAGAYYLGANSANNALIFSNSGGSEVVRFDSSGNVGIGTSSPGDKLQVNGGIRSVDGTTTSRFITSSNTCFFGTLTGDPIVIQTNNTERMRVDASGFIQMGSTDSINASEVAITGTTTVNTTNFLGTTGTLSLSSFANSTLNQCGIFMRAYDAANLAVGGSIHVVPVTGFRGNLVSTYMADGAGGAYIINQFRPSPGDTVERMRITSDGNVGIGTSSPSVRLQTNGAVAIQGTAAFPSSGAGIELYYDTTNGSHIQSYDRTASAWKDLRLNSGLTVFSTAGAERMRIDSSGNVGIGTSSPSTRLQINGQTRISDGTTNIDIVCASTIGFIGTQTNAPLVLRTNDTERMRITSTGQLRTTVTGTTMMDEYGCRAWVNFNGTGTVAIRASGNVSSITDNGTGNYRVNFTTAMPDINYSISVACQWNTGVTSTSVATINGDSGSTPTTSNFTMMTYNTNNNATFDSAGIFAAVFR